MSVGDSGQCLCHVYLPDTTFSASRVEHMQQVTKDLILEVTIQIEKVLQIDERHHIKVCDIYKWLI